jgi:ubiquinone/menaquinone biosynthesis C-methylase UbiE
MVLCYNEDYMKKIEKAKSWGTLDDKGAEIWDMEPVFRGDTVQFLDWCKLLFYPKKWVLYRHIKKSRNQESIKANLDNSFRILDVGCGTGAAVIDFKKMFGRSVEVIGLDVVKMQIELARPKLRKYGVWAKVEEFDGENVPFPANYFDAIHTSDVLGHVENVPKWLDNLNRVLKPNGVLAMFTESAPGKHAYLTNYFLKRGLNVDPHEEFHISLFSKKKLLALLKKSGFGVDKVLSLFWASFLVHPDEYYPKLSKSRKFPFLRTINTLLYHSKKLIHPVSTAVAEFYGLVEMYMVGKYVEGQGYIILARKQE